jgi:hypothetical protein
MLTQEKLKQCLRYDAESGVFYRISTSKCHADLLDKPAGRAHKKRGYREIWVDGKLYYAHRLAFLYMTGKWPDCLVDHIDHNKDNNSWANLREADYVTNGQNQVKANKHSKTGVLGVKVNGPHFSAGITVNGKSHHLGTFKTIDQASAVYQSAKRLLHVSTGAST